MVVDNEFVLQKKDGRPITGHPPSFVTKKWLIIKIEGNVKRLT